MQTQESIQITSEGTKLENALIVSNGVALSGLLVSLSGTLIEKYVLVDYIANAAKVYVARVSGNFALSVLETIGNVQGVENWVRSIKMKMQTIPASEIIMNTGICVITTGVIIGTAAIIVDRIAKNKQVLNSD